MKKIALIAFIIFFCCCCIKTNRPQWQYSAESPSKNFYYIVEEIDRSYCVQILSYDKIIFIDPEKYRMRDRFYITWAENEDVLWLYSSDIGIFGLYPEGGEWVKKNSADCRNAGFVLPSIFFEILPEGVIKP
jgi:hypothetical protein